MQEIASRIRITLSPRCVSRSVARECEIRRACAGCFVAAIETTRLRLKVADRSGSPLIATEAGNSLAKILVAAVAAGAREATALTDAERFAVEAGVIADAAGDRAETARTLATCAEIARLRGETAHAEDLTARAGAIYREIGHRLGSEFPADPDASS